MTTGAELSSCPQASHHRGPGGRASGQHLSSNRCCTPHNAAAGRWSGASATPQRVEGHPGAGMGQEKTTAKHFMTSVENETIWPIWKQQLLPHTGLQTSSFNRNSSCRRVLDTGIIKMSSTCSRAPCFVVILLSSPKLCVDLLVSV